MRGMELFKHRDVYLVYIESYGTTVFDTPEFRQALQVSLTRFETTLRNSGYTIASNRLVSPTFGGGSWLAHATLGSGVRLDDPVLYSQLLASGRKRADSPDPQTKRGQDEQKKSAAMSSRSPLNTDSSCATGAGQMELGHGCHSRVSTAAVAISQTVTELLLILDDEGLA